LAERQSNLLSDTSKFKFGDRYITTDIDGAGIKLVPYGTYKDKLDEYTAIGGTKSDFDKLNNDAFVYYIDKDIKTENWHDVAWDDAEGEEEDGYVTDNGSNYDLRLNGGLGNFSKFYGSSIPLGDKGNIAYMQHLGNPKSYLAYTKTNRDSPKWVYTADNGDGYLKTRHKAIFGYETGGLADFTGPAWLDGTPSKPEYILNAKQTERFFSLIDVLEGIDTKESKNIKTGDSYFDININVDKLESDYDVEKVADKIRRMIYEDASYRNVNAINLIR
jgi:hypothetical protein